MCKRKLCASTHVFGSVLLICATTLTLLSAADKKTFKSKLYGYAVEYPSDWRLQSLAGVFSIENFPPSKMVRGVRLPPGGASIVIQVPAQAHGRSMPDNIEEWIHKGTAHQTVSSKREFTLDDGGSKTIPIVEIRAECCVVPPFLQYKEWFFQIEGHYFQASLVYWQCDQNANTLEETLKQIVRSLKVTRS